MISTAKYQCENCHKTFTLTNESQGLRAIEVSPGVWKEFCAGCALEWYSKKHLIQESDE